MKVQLFVPPGGYTAERWSQGSSMPPLGLLYLAAVLEKEGIRVQVVPSDILKMTWKQIKEKIQEFKPHLIGITSTTENRFQSFKLIRVAKKAYPSALTILGGPHASMAAEDSLEHIPELDGVIRGEGEKTLLALCQALGKENQTLDLSTIPGLTHRQNGHIHSNPPPSPIQELDSLPFPAFHLIPFEKYNFKFPVPGEGMLPAVNMMTSRGCPFNCNFCATPINWGRRVRMRSPQNTVQEMERLIQKYGIKVFFFFDDTFNANPQRVEQICDLILEKNLDIFWKCDVRVDLLNKPLLEKMKRAGLFHLSFGLEAGSERVRNQIVRKKIDVQDFHQLITWCNELRIVPNAFFILSHPTETWEEARETLRIIEQYKDKIEASIAVLHIYPGTPLEKTAQKKGILPSDFTWTRKRDPRIITLPTAQGDVPLFKDKLTWTQISELLFRWSFTEEKYSLFRKIPAVLSNIRSWGDIHRYTLMGWVYLKLKLKKIFSKKRLEAPP
ncbi:B12-binding domain-containing radical SAM protein [bacterium]|nr:B12-binding domain-containing radical SAM protein [bacterium]